MTSETIEMPADLMTRAGVDATYQHIELLNRKREQLRVTQIAAEEQFLHQLARAYRERRLTEIELAKAYRAYASLAVPGFMGRWQAAVPTHPARMANILRYLGRDDPNMPDGAWRGSWPLAKDGPLPAYGTCVVYVLYDAANDPCYVGSSQNLRSRLKDHSKDGKEFAFWTAFPCADREAAYQLEERMLSEFQPYLNRKRSR